MGEAFGIVDLIAQKGSCYGVVRLLREKGP